MNRLERTLLTGEFGSRKSWCKSSDVEKIESLVDELLERLEIMSSQHRCGCGHPHCNRCEDDKMNDVIINKVRGTV